MQKNLFSSIVKSLVIFLSVVIFVLIIPQKIFAQTCTSWWATQSSLPSCSSNLFQQDCTGSGGFTGTQCCTTPIAQGGLGYDYCENRPRGITPLYEFRCCNNLPTPTPTPTNTPTPTPTPTLWLIKGTVYYDNDNNGVFDRNAGDDDYGSGAHILVKDVTADNLLGPYITDSFGVYQTPRIWPDQHSVNVTLTTSPPAGCTVTSANPANRLMISDATVNYSIYCPSPLRQDATVIHAL
ncbi:MAG: hypothetical protein HYW62_01455 [Candidatus Levybacteria bacterium]|nr:hypothetical protein [Candidatus Levybacteria bacterium]